MKNALLKAFGIITTVSALALCSQTVQAALVYDNTNTRLPERFGSLSGFEFGDEITLAGGATIITNFSIEYFGTNFTGNEQLTVRIYAMTGPTNSGSGNAFTPGATPLYDSGPFNIAQSPGASLNFDNVSIAVPERIAWTIEFSGVVANELAGLNVYSPPTVGNNFNNFWLRRSSTAWGLESFTDGVPANFGARFEADFKFNAPVAPSISSVTGPGNGSYRAGQNLDFTANFSESVTVNTSGGTPTIGLTIGSTARNATYVSGSGSSSLVFRYTVQAGDNDSDGIGSASPVFLNGGTIRDSVGNNASLTFTPPLTSGVLVDTPSVPPSILSQPLSQTAALGQAVSFSVSAAGREPLFYRWRFNGIDITGATNDTLTLVNLGTNHAGSYLVEMSNLDGSIASQVVTLSVLSPPNITTQPASASVPSGSGVTFSVTATGSPPLTYQWRLNGINLPTMTNSTLTLPNVSPTQSGSYDVAVANAVGAISSANAVLDVQAVPVAGLADNFGGRVRIDTFVKSTNQGATRELGEPNHAGKPGGKSVWFSWLAPSGGVVTLSTRGSSFDTLLAVYTGANLSSLTEVGSDDDSGGFFSSQLKFTAAAGTEYQIAVDGFGQANGTVILSLSFVSGPQSVPRIVTAPKSQSVSEGTNVTFAVVAQSPTALSYQWFFNGTAIAGATDSSLTLPNVLLSAAGNYTVVVSTASESVTTPPVVLEIGPAPGVLSEDKFLDVFTEGESQPSSQSLAVRRKSNFSSVSVGTLGTQVLSTLGATKEQGEPNHANVIGGASRWLRFRAKESGIMVVDTERSEFDTVLAVYTGPTLLNLQLVASDDNGAADGVRSLVKFSAARGTDYLVVVDGVRGAQGKVHLNWRLGLPPVITQAPVGGAVRIGDRVVLSAAVDGTPAPIYQWRLNGLNIAGATNAALVLDNVQIINEGTYRVALSNFVGTAVSRPAALTVSAAGPLRLGNWSRTDGLFRFELSGVPGSSYVIEGSTNLVSWLPIFTNSAPSGRIEFNDRDSTNYPHRFYRASPAP